MFTVGVDLGKRKSQYAVLDAEGKPLVERALPNRREIVQKFLRGLPGPLEVGCETCINSYWLVEVVEAAGFPIQVGHALKMRLIAESRIKTDRVDAKVIAELLRTRFFPSIAIPPAEIRQARELLRGRVRMVRTRVQQRNRLHGILTRAGIDYTARDLVGPGVEAWLDGLDLAPAPRAMAGIYLGMMQDADSRIRALDRAIREQIRPVEPWAAIMQRLETIPGVGPFSAMLLLLELWDLSRFSDVKHLASYVGLVPSVHQSGQHRWGGPLTKQGNGLVRWILVEDAWVAIRQDSRYRGLYEHHVPRQGRRRAIIPVARQVLADVYAV